MVKCAHLNDIHERETYVLLASLSISSELILVLNVHPIADIIRVFCRRRLLSLDLNDENDNLVSSANIELLTELFIILGRSFILIRNSN